MVQIWLNSQFCDFDDYRFSEIPGFYLPPYPPTKKQEKNEGEKISMVGVISHKPEVDNHTVLFNKDILAADPQQNIRNKVRYIRSSKNNLGQYIPKYTPPTF